MVCDMVCVLHKKCLSQFYITRNIKLLLTVVTIDCAYAISLFWEWPGWYDSKPSMAIF